MLGPETIARMSDIAAYQAAEEGRTPLVLWNAERDLHHAPFLGQYVPAGWRRARWDEGVPKPRRWVYATGHDECAVEVDGSGFGGPTEPALTYPELVSYADEVAGQVTDLTVGWAILEAGEFQVVFGIFVKDPEAPGTEAPSFEDVMCPDCGEVHGEFDECPGRECSACGETYYGPEGEHEDCEEAEVDLNPEGDPTRNGAFMVAPGQTSWIN